jgi:predicted nucleotidyltransferase
MEDLKGFISFCRKLNLGLVEPDFALNRLVNLQNAGSFPLPISKSRKFSGIDSFLINFIEENDCIRDIVFFGSYGDLTSIEYSDLDLLVIVEKNTLGNDTVVSELSKVIRNTLIPYMFSINPLQHHGVFFYFLDLGYLPGSYLIPEALTESRSLVENQTIRVLPNLCKIELDSIYRKALFQGRLALNSGCSYDFFQFNSSVLLLKSYYLQSKGLETSKKESFKEDVLGLNGLSEAASVIRLDWHNSMLHKKLTFYLVTFFDYNPFVLARILSFVFRKNVKKKKLLHMIEELELLCV